MDFAKCLRNSDHSKNRKVYLADFFKMDFMKGTFTLIKVDQMHNILKSASHCLLFER